MQNAVKSILNYISQNLKSLKFYCVENPNSEREFGFLFLIKLDIDIIFYFVYLLSALGLFSS